MVLRHCDVYAKLVLREGHTLDSRKLGNVYPGTKKLLVLDEVTAADGSVRAHIGKDSSPRGLIIDKLGWVTAYKEGEWILTPPGESAASDRTTAMRDDVVHDSLASRIAARRQLRVNERKGRMTTPRTPKSAEVEAPTSTAVTDLAAATAASASPLAPPPLKLEVFHGSARLLELAQEQNEAANQVEAQTFDTIESTLGQLLLRKNVKVEHLVSEWDRNRDGEISRNEFRINVRSLGLTEAMAAGLQVDALYDSMDLDNSESLSIDEMKQALQKLKSDVKDVGRQEAQNQERVAALRRVGQLYEGAAEATRVYEEEQQRLVAFKTGTVATRLGQQLKSRVIKVHQVVLEWDKDGGGSLDKAEFRHNVRSEIGFKATDDELDELFDWLDDDHSGELEIKEVMSSFKKLQEAAMNQKRDETAMTKAVGRAKKEAEARQLECQEALVEIERRAIVLRQKAEEELQARKEAEAKVKAEAHWAKVRENRRREQVAQDGAKFKFTSE